MNESEACRLLMEKGLVKPNPDGTYQLSDEAHVMLTKLIDERPELYAQIFPDRLN